MPSKELYLAAEAFQKAKVWEMLYDSDLFGVRYEDGEIGYVSVMGNEKRHFAMALYMGEAGLYSYSQIESLPGDASLSLRRDRFLSQECLMCSFEKPGELSDKDEAELRKYGISHAGKHMVPMLRKYVPFKYPWYIDDLKDEQRLFLALKAGMEVAKRLVHDIVQMSMASPESGLDKAKQRLGFAPDMLPVLTADASGFSWNTERLPDECTLMSPSPSLTNEMEIARLKKLRPEPGRVWYCHVMIFPAPIHGEPPRFPATMMLLDNKKGMARMPLVEKYPEKMTQVLNGFLDYLAEQGKPECVYVQGGRTYSLLQLAAKQIGLTLVEKDRISEIEQEEDDFLRYIESGGMEGERSIPGERKPHAGKAHSAGSVGFCTLCGKLLDKSALLKHVKSCEKRKLEPGDQRYFILRVEASDAPEYFLFLDVMADTTLRRLDKYLRDIWLECCGHLSMFTVQGEKYYSTAVEYGDMGMNYKLENLVTQGESFRYEYDFGSSTDLKLKVAGMYIAKRRRTKIMLQARNAAPQFACVSCKKPAELVLAGYGDDLGERAYCGACANDLQDGEGFLPIMNSPRCGVCAYGLEWAEDGEDGEE